MAPTDDGANGQGSAPKAGPSRSFMDWVKKPLVLAASAAVLAGFGGGYLAARAVDGTLFSGPVRSTAASSKGEAWGLFGKPRAANAKRAAPAKPDGFAVWKWRIDTSKPDPVACIELTRPLDPAKAYADFVLVSPELGAAPAVTAKGSELCVAGLGFNDRRITLLKGLPSAGKDMLAANADVDVVFGDKPPYVGFAGDGVILPREEADGVGIETMNVAKLAIEVWRIPDRNLVRKEIIASQPAGEGDYLEGDDNPEEEGRKVWSGELAIKGPAGERVTTVFPLGAVLKEMLPGGYVIKARDASGEGAQGKKAAGADSDESEGDGEQNRAAARRWVIFTDMALTAYSGSDGVDVVVRSLKTAKTLAGVRMALVAKNGETLAESKADASGRVKFASALLDGDSGQRAKMIMAYGAQGDLAVLDLDRSPVDLSKQGVGGRTDPEAAPLTGGRTATETVDSYIYSDRGIYRPGEMVHLVAMVRDRDAASLKDRKGSLVILRPSGLEYQRVKFDKSDLGVVTKDVLLPKSAPRGRWSARLEIEGGQGPAGQMSFAVEDFAPQRLAVETEAQKAKPIVAGETRVINVMARFLYGAPGAGLQTQAEARISADPNPFPQFKDYQFGDDQHPYQEIVPDPLTTLTDGAGRATINFPSSAGGDTMIPLKATITAAVFEPGGRPVRESVTLKLRPKPLYLGVKIDQGDSTRGDTPVSFDIIGVTGAGQRTTANGLSWSLIAERWDFDWYQQNGRWSWRRTSRDAVVEKGTGATTPARSLRYTRKLGWGDYRLEVTGADGIKSVIKFSAGWGSPAAETESPDFVRVSAGTKAYVQGDGVDITIKGPYAGEAQIAVATDRIIDFKTVHIGEGGATVHLKSSAAWGGGAYVMVSLIQPRDPEAAPKPRRALGLVYVPLDPKSRKLTVDIGTPAKLDAKAVINVPVKVNGLGLGQRARVTIAAVDEGILRLTKFDTPDPVKWYFGKRALGVDYRDDYGRLLDPNLGAAAQLNYGADEIGGEGLTVTPIKSVALWSGVVETGIDGKATVPLPAAQFNGELRLMAVAWTDSAVGSGAKSMTVREAVVAELNLPRFLAPGDKATSVIELHNLDGKAGDYNAEVVTKGGILAPFKKLIALALGQRTTDRVEVAAPTTVGVGNVALNVSGPGFSTVRSYPIETRIGWGAETRVVTELQQPNSAYTPPLELLSGLSRGSVTLQVSYSPFRGFDPAAVAVALERYPYGCTEQLVSTAYPLLYAAKFTSDPKIKRTTPQLNEAVGKLLDRQTLDGAFGLWRVGDGEADAWLGAFATDFLIEAKLQGAPVPDVAVDRALNAMRLISKPDGWAAVSYRLDYPPWWMLNDEASKKATARMRSRASAYALYVLAKGGRGDLARLRWWHDVQMKSDSSPLARAQIAAGLAMMGDHARAHSAMNQAVAALGYRDEGDWYQSGLRDLAGVINYAYEAGETATARALQVRLDGAVKDPDSLNTQEQARLLQAAYQMLKAAGPVKITATGAVPMGAVGGTPRWGVGKLGDAKFVNAGTGGVYRTVTVRGVPQAAPAPKADGLQVSKALWTMGGGQANLAAVAQGERIIVQVSGVSRQGRSMMLVVDDALPAGFEVETVLGPDDSTTGPFKFLGVLTTPNIQEARDDRYVASLSLAGGKPFSLAYVARAVTPGNFFLPGAEARDMYRPTVMGRSSGSRLTIAAAGP